MSTEEQQIKFVAAKRTLYQSVQNSVASWQGLRAYAASRIEQHKNELSIADPVNPSQIASLQGRIQEMRDLANLEDRILDFLKKSAPVVEEFDEN
jgi:hypothetical protein